MPDLPPRQSLEHLRKQAKTRKRERRIGLSQAQHELAREYGSAGWPKLVHPVQASMLDGIERALVLADTKALAVARGESVRLPAAPPPAKGLPAGRDYGWILGQFASLGQTAVVQALLDSGLPVDTRGWSNFTPLDQAAMHGRTDTVRLLIERGADLHDRAFDEDGPTPLDCALWGLKNNRADDGDYPGTVQAMLAAGAPTRQSPPTAVTRRSTRSSPRTRPDADDLPAHGRTGMPTSVGMSTRAQHPALTSSASDRAIALTWPIAPQGGR